MAPKNVILAALLALSVSAYGQTRSLLVNPSGVVQYTNAVEWQGALSFGANTAAQAATRSNLSLGLPALTNTTGAGLLSAIGGLATNGSAEGLTNFPASLLATNSAESSFPAELMRTNGDASALTNYPSELLRTNGDGSGLTNLPNADLGSATGILPLANGGTGATNASEARTALELGSAATNDATAFQPASTNLTALSAGDGSSLTNVTVTDAGTLTNFPAELLRTNGDAAGLTNFPADLLRTNGDAAALTNFPSELLRTNGDGSGLSNVSVDLTTVLPAYSNNAGLVLAVTTNETGVEWIAVSNTVTDASTLTNFPASLLTTNGDAAGLTNFPSELLRTNGDGSGLTNLPFVGGASATNVGPIMAYFNNNATNIGTGGSITAIANGIVVTASATNNSFAAQRFLITAGLFVGINTPLNFTNSFSFGGHIGISGLPFAKANKRFYVGVSPSYSTNNPTNTVIGWRFKDHEIFAAYHNGSSYVEPFSTNGVFDTNNTSYAWTWVEGDGNGTVSWYINGQLLGTVTNGPTNLSDNRYGVISSHNDTGGSTTNATALRLLNFISNFK